MSASSDALMARAVPVPRPPEATPYEEREAPLQSRDEVLMHEVLELARGAGRTSPNPRVAALLVRDDEPVAHGVHRGPGSPHAEIVALGHADAAGATLYVNLEPCSHHGRTGPCAPALVEAGIGRVVVAMEDPDTRVAGAGIALLRSAGIPVEVGVLESEALALNRAYVHHRTTGLPWVTVKVALTVDGYMAAADGSSRWITSPEARRRVHEMRAETDAVLVGSGTVETDDPRLTARDVNAHRQPLRVVVDGSGRTSPRAEVFAPDGEVMVATAPSAAHEVQTAWKASGAEVVVVPSEDGRVDLRSLLELLGRREVTEVLCEGGGRLISSLLREGLVNALQVHHGPVLTGSGPRIESLGIGSMDGAQRWALESSETLGDTVVTTYGRR